MDLPASLPACVYLLAVNPANNRLASRSMLGKALRAAALEQLAHEGRLVDRNGRPQATGGCVDDAFLESVLAAVRNSKPRKWTHWVGRDERRACRAVEEQVIAAGLATVDAHRVLGLIPCARVKVRDDRANEGSSQPHHSGAHRYRAGLPPGAGAGCVGRHRCAGCLSHGGRPAHPAARPVAG